MITLKFFTFSPVQENTYVLYNEHKQAIIIDPGCYFDEEKNSLDKYIHDNDLTVVKLLNTHCHLDHIFGNKWVHEKYGVELHLHPKEEQVLAFGPSSGIKWGLPFDNYEGPLHFIYEGEEITLGTDVFKVILTPGHSPGSLCFYCEEQKLLIGGDVLFRDSIGRTDLPLGDHETLLKSIRTKLFVLPDDVVVYSGHGPSTTIGYEKRNNPFLQ